MSPADSSSDHTVSCSEMAVSPKSDSDVPLVILTGGSEHSFLSKEDFDDEPREEERDALVQAIGPHLSRVMQRGTAKHVHPAEEEEEHDEEPCVSIVAQAESETVHSLLMLLSGLFTV